MTTLNPTLRATLVALAVATATASAAASIPFAGNLGDPGNAALVGSDLGAALFDPDDVADNVALYTFVVAEPGLVTIDSTGFAAGGVDPYFSLFAGGGTTATFVDSNYVQAYSTGGDFDYTATLAAGTYQIALGTFANMSFAENYGSGTLGDGFIGFGSADSFGDGGYALAVTVPVPEPSSLNLAALGLAALAVSARRLRRATRRHDGATSPGELSAGRRAASLPSVSTGALARTTVTVQNDSATTVDDTLPR